MEIALTASIMLPPPIAKINSNLLLTYFFFTLSISAHVGSGFKLKSIFAE